jgi:hypothetical protein
MKILCESCGALSEARLVGRPGGAVVVCAACGAEAAVAGETAVVAARAVGGAAVMPGEPAAVPPEASPAHPLPSGEEEAWSALGDRWGDPEAHRAFLARFTDLEGLARTGARYREVLATRPGDRPAARARDEILRRATALALAEAPRPSVRAPLPPAVKWGVVALLAGTLLGAAAWVAFTLAGLGAMR